ncbi:MAG: hypothetical protein M1819_005233 [Sarea resinae]|nr:MAG: hypothetical protein M1819_005233 [Sarea resinae]
MADDDSHGNLSLIPYTSHGEVVLRHNDAVVVYDPESRHLILRDASNTKPDTVEPLSNCPYCHRPLRTEHETSSSRTQRGPSPAVDTSFISNEYFRMLHHSSPESTGSSTPLTPQGRLAQLIPDGTETPTRPPAGAEFIGSTPAAPPPPHGISSAAFSPNYFKRFFIEEGELGRGGKGVVLLVKHVLDGVTLGHFACKRVPVGDDHEWLEKVLMEVQLLQHLSHPNLVSYRHVWLEDVKLTNFGPSVPCAFILQQYCNAGDLHRYIYQSAKTTSTTQQLKERLRRRSKGQPEPPQNLQGPKRLSFEEIYSFFRDITSGLSHLHANGYIHRDLKPSNCLLHNTGKEMKVLLSDFGEVQVENMARKSTGATGTISYCAPEVLRRDRPGGVFGNFTTKSDIFSLGMILYFMCFGRLPYSNSDDINEEEEDLEQLREEITAWSGFDDNRRVRTDLPEKLYRFLRRLLSVDPNQRPSADDILQGIKTGTGMEDTSGYAHGPSSRIFEDIRSDARITRLDSPSPSTPNERNPDTQATASSAFTRPGPSKLRLRSFPKEDDKENLPTREVDADGGASPNGSSLVLRPRPAKFPSPTMTPPTPRLMGPPTNPSIWRTPMANSVVAEATRGVLFFLKVVSVTRPCSPQATSPWVTYPLLLLALFDLGVVDFGHSGTILLLVVHMTVLFLASRWDVLCMPKGAAWEAL